MKKIKKIVKWTSLVLAIIIVGIGTITASRQNIKYKAPYPKITASKDSAVIARGRHLAISIAHCTDCHNKANTDSILSLGQDPILSGGIAFKLPVGTIYSANITSDPEHGIGKYSDGEIARALRYGVHPDGTVVYDFMPFHNLSDSDLTAVISFLRTQKPAPIQKPQNQLNVMGNLVKAFLIKPVGPSEKIVPAVKEDSSAAYGKYLVHSVGNCNGCHTKRTLSGEVIGELLAGGNEMPNGMVTPNITPDSSGRIFGWSQEKFIKRFRTGKLIPYSEMPWSSFQKMSDLELKAIYNYLQTVKPVRTWK
ncbi:c-type cytochrome [Flavihumibacter fluvii]|uniref:c-type cytochrome n=1 Tax=Flavihumibacter fluvii TaxID=2838157 RepID=UPI001BDE5956|nr:cytochrome c [Flavihumibacter fluvii]ULQ53309.1 cytochrome c [Flavihumibacter fluvii]